MQGKRPRGGSHNPIASSTSGLRGSKMRSLMGRTNGNAATSRASRPGGNMLPDFYASRGAHAMGDHTDARQQTSDNLIHARPNPRRETHPTEDNAIADEEDFLNKFSDNWRDPSRYNKQKPQMMPVYDGYKIFLMAENDQKGFSPPNNDNFNYAAEVLQAPTPRPFVSNLKPRTLTYRPPSLVYEDIHEACIRYVKEHSFYSSRFVREMDLTDIKNDSAFYYVLKTFCEKRETTVTSVPYIGQVIDSWEKGTPPAPWDIYVQPPALFEEGKVEKEIPHTACVESCPKCTGTGRVTCSCCYGRARRRCFLCFGSGRIKEGMCTVCFGSGRSWCTQCSGSGKEKCENCDGRKHVKLYRMLIVTWMTFTDNIMSNRHNLPEKYLQSVTGSRILFEEDEMLTPIVNAPDEYINLASASFMERHREDYQNMRILKQRHILKAIPFTKVLYTWRDRESEFYVYGHEKKVHFEQYPQKYCCCTCL